MNTIEFGANVKGTDFSFQKLMLTSGIVVFFVKDNDNKNVSFFMSKIKDRGWQILYHKILGRDILDYETDLQKIIEEKGY